MTAANRVIQQATPVLPGPIRRYMLDQTSGTNAPDTGSQEDNATLTSASWAVGGGPLPGILDNAMDAGAGTVYATASVIGLPSGSAPRSITFWCKYDGRGIRFFNLLLCYGVTVGTNFVMYVDVTNTLIFDPGGGGGSVSNSTALVDGNWHHVAFVVGGGSYSTYIDGTLDKSGSLSLNTALGPYLYIAADNTGDAIWIGLMADVQIYDRTITAAEVAVIYAGGASSSSAASTTVYQYDAGGNAIATTRTETCTITEPTVADEVFQSAAWFDCMGRMTAQATQGADGSFNPDLNACCCQDVPFQTLFSVFGYDSRGNRTLAVDPKDNSVITLFDGATRALRTIQLLRVSGQGYAGPLPNDTFLPGAGSSIVTTTIYDANSQVTQLIDDRGGVSSYLYDTLDRQTQMIFHDGSTRTSVYNDASDVITYTDENGSVFANTFDPLGRKTTVAITLATDVEGTTAQSFQYDGLSRMTFARDSVSSTNADVTTVYDSLGRTLEESQTYGSNTRNATNDAFTSYPVSQFTFPSGRKIDNTYDAALPPDSSDRG